VNELYRLFVFEPASMAVRQDDAEIHQWLVQMNRHVAEAASISLAELYAGKYNSADE